jgi:hypothetical protein
MKAIHIPIYFQGKEVEKFLEIKFAKGRSLAFCRADPFGSITPVLKLSTGTV